MSHPVVQVGIQSIPAQSAQSVPTRAPPLSIAVPSASASVPMTDGPALRNPDQYRSSLFGTNTTTPRPISGPGHMSGPGLGFAGDHRRDSLHRPPQSYQQQQRGDPRAERDPRDYSEGRSSLDRRPDSRNYGDLRDYRNRERYEKDRDWYEKGRDWYEKDRRDRERYERELREREQWEKEHRLERERQLAWQNRDHRVAYDRDRDRDRDQRDRDRDLSRYQAEYEATDRPRSQQLETSPYPRQNINNTPSSDSEVAPSNPQAAVNLATRTFSSATGNSGPGLAAQPTAAAPQSTADIFPTAASYALGPIGRRPPALATLSTQVATGRVGSPIDIDDDDDDGDMPPPLETLRGEIVPATVVSAQGEIASLNATFTANAALRRIPRKSSSDASSKPGDTEVLRPTSMGVGPRYSLQSGDSVDTASSGAVVDRASSRTMTPSSSARGSPHLQPARHLPSTLENILGRIQDIASDDDEATVVPIFDTAVTPHDEALAIATREAKIAEREALFPDEVARADPEVIAFALTRRPAVTEEQVAALPENDIMRRLLTAVADVERAVEARFDRYLREMIVVHIPELRNRDHRTLTLEEVESHGSFLLRQPRPVKPDSEKCPLLLTPGFMMSQQLAELGIDALRARHVAHIAPLHNYTQHTFAFTLLFVSSLNFANCDADLDAKLSLARNQVQYARRMALAGNPLNLELPPVEPPLDAGYERARVRKGVAGILDWSKVERSMVPQLVRLTSSEKELALSLIANTNARSQPQRTSKRTRAPLSDFSLPVVAHTTDRSAVRSVRMSQPLPNIFAYANDTSIVGELLRTLCAEVTDIMADSYEATTQARPTAHELAHLLDGTLGGRFAAVASVAPPLEPTTRDRAIAIEALVADGKINSEVLLAIATSPLDEVEARHVDRCIAVDPTILPGQPVALTAYTLAKSIWPEQGMDATRVLPTPWYVQPDFVMQIRRAGARIRAQHARLNALSTGSTMQEAEEAARNAALTKGENLSPGLVLQLVKEGAAVVKQGAYLAALANSTSSSDKYFARRYIQSLEYMQSQKDIANAIKLGAYASATKAKTTTNTDAATVRTTAVRTESSKSVSATRIVSSVASQPVKRLPVVPVLTNSSVSETLSSADKATRISASSSASKAEKKDNKDKKDKREKRPHESGSREPSRDRGPDRDMDRSSSSRHRTPNSDTPHVHNRRPATPTKTANMTDGDRDTDDVQLPLPETHSKETTVMSDASTSKSKEVGAVRDAVASVAMTAAGAKLTASTDSITNGNESGHASGTKTAASSTHAAKPVAHLKILTNVKSVSSPAASPTAPASAKHAKVGALTSQPPLECRYRCSTCTAETREVSKTVPRCCEICRGRNLTPIIGNQSPVA